jgi:hypothetical protein
MATELPSDLNQSFPKWTPWDFVKWKVVPTRFGGGVKHLVNYKDGWVMYNRTRIVHAALGAKIPIELLAGIAWIEAGGMPDLIDSIALPVRSFDWCGPDLVDRHRTITSNPNKTSFGSVSIQLRVAAKMFGIDIENLDYVEKLRLSRALEVDAVNLHVVAKHIFNLIKFDYPDADTANLNDEQIGVVGSRYNRGTSRSKEDLIESLNASPGSQIREYSSNGRTILRHRGRVRRLLQIAPR